jgi:hypothetical protein
VAYFFRLSELSSIKITISFTFRSETKLILVEYGINLITQWLNVWLIRYELIFFFNYRSIAHLVNMIDVVVH